LGELTGIPVLSTSTLDRLRRSGFARGKNPTLALPKPGWEAAAWPRRVLSSVLRSIPPWRSLLRPRRALLVKAPDPTPQTLTPSPQPPAPEPISAIMPVMFDLPLFPLGTVLFPGMPLPLHIFEDRYKIMIGLCLERRQPFGVVLIKEGVEALGSLAEPHLVGCTARITQVERLGQGRMIIGVIGRRRFRILSLNRDLPYLVGKAVYYPLSDEETGTDDAARRLRPLVIRYMEELSRIEGTDFNPVQIPEESISLAFTAAALLRIPVIQKQAFLAALSADELLRDLRKHYRREVAFLKVMVERKVKDQGPFSLN